MRLFLCLFLFLVSCKSTPKETKAGKKVKVVQEIADPYACTQLGKTQYDGTPFIDEAELTSIGREMAVELRGNTVRFDVFEPGINGVRRAKLRATVFSCKGSKPAAKKADPNADPKAAKVPQKEPSEDPQSPAEDRALPPPPEL